MNRATRTGYLPDRSPTGHATAIYVVAGTYRPDDPTTPDERRTAPSGRLYPTRDEAIRAARRRWNCTT